MLVDVNHPEQAHKSPLNRLHTNSGDSPRSAMLPDHIRIVKIVDMVRVQHQDISSTRREDELRIRKESIGGAVLRSTNARVVSFRAVAGA